MEIRLTNPHSILVFDVTDASGKVVRWQAEMTGGQQLVKQFGWTKDSPKVGDKVTLNGRKVKNGAPYMSMAKRAHMILADSGKEIYVESASGRLAAASPPAAPPASPPARSAQKP